MSLAGQLPWEWLVSQRILNVSVPSDSHWFLEELQRLMLPILSVGCGQCTGPLSDSFNVKLLFLVMRVLLVDVEADIAQQQSDCPADAPYVVKQVVFRRRFWSFDDLSVWASWLRRLCRPSASRRQGCHRTRWTLLSWLTMKIERSRKQLSCCERVSWVVQPKR